MVRRLSEQAPDTDVAEPVCLARGYEQTGGLSISHRPVVLPLKQGFSTHFVPWAPLVVRPRRLRKTSLNAHNKIGSQRKPVLLKSRP